MSEFPDLPDLSGHLPEIPSDDKPLDAVDDRVVSELRFQSKFQEKEQPYKRKTYWKSEYDGLVAPNTVYWQRYLHYLWEENKLQHHVERIINARPRVDCKPPLINPKYFFNPKKLEDVRECYRVRDYQNEDMVRRIALAVSSQRKNRVDCWNKKEQRRFNTIPFAKQRLRQVKKDNGLLLEKVLAVRECYVLFAFTIAMML